MKWVFDRHGKERAILRGIPGRLVEIALHHWDEERAGKTPGTRIRVGWIDGGRVAVLHWPGDPIRVHSVRWDMP